MLHLKDAELLEMVRKGQESAFTILYNRYQPVMLTVAKKKLSNLQEAEDVVQEIFTSFWQRREQISLSIPVKHYFLRAVHFQYAYKCRTNAVARKYEHFLSGTILEDGNLAFLENKELGYQIRSAIQKISAPACRKIFELAYIEDRSCNEIATSLNICAQVVRNQTSRALKVLRAELRQVV
ncbi:sigma-70 family RNA polymerase sigma factor [Chitinophaga sp.]|uniref:RNA polymerase sigma factor n=1 Tax=Chitinophaga sp. TaxID=1869181 RepID=UPI0031D65034